MLRTQTTFIRIITLFIIFVLTVACLVACNSQDNGADESADGTSDAPTDAPIDDGVNRIFADGDFACKVIRAETASADERQTSFLTSKV